MAASADALSKHHLEVDAPIRRVTVFPNGALVTRRGRAAPGSVRVRDLPLLYVSDSLRVRPARGAVAGLEETCELELSPAPPPPSEAERRDLERREADLDDRLRTTEALLAIYAGLEAKDDPRFEPKDTLPDAERWLSLLSLSKDRLLSLEQKRAALVREKRALARERRALEQRERGDRAPPRFSRGVSFSLEGARAGDHPGDVADVDAGEVEFDLEYFVEAARWVPSYTLKLEADRAELVLSALVAQASGEDWTGAELFFSTADLSRETTLPELLSWRMGRAQPPRRPAFRPLPGDLEALFAGYDAGKQRAPSPLPRQRPRHDDARARTRSVADDEWEEATEATRASLPGALFGSAGSAESAPPDVTFYESPPPDLSFAAEPMPEESFAGGPPPPPPPASAPPPAPRRIRTPSPAKKQSAVRSSAMAAMAAQEPSPAELEPLPPRLRYAYLRLMGPEEPGRGTLQPLDPLSHLWSLVEDHEGVDVSALKRAVAALEAAAKQLHGRALPPGTVPVEGASFHHVYRAPGAHDLASDGAYHRVVVERHETPATSELRSVPRESNDVYRFCLLKTPVGVPFAAGPLEVYEDGAFRVGASLSTTGGGGKLELNLGVEPAVRILGRTANVEQQEKGLVSQTSRVEHKVRVQVRSSLPRAARLVLYDRLPVPRDDVKDIEVRLEESDPPAVRDDRDPLGWRLEGGLHWVVELGAGETRDVTWRYTIALPAKTELVGGNRRE